MAVMNKKYLVTIKDVGESNLLTNQGIIRLFEDVACSHSEIAGYGINQIQQTRLSWILLLWKVKVFKRLPFNSTVDLHTWSRDCSLCTTYRDFEMYDDNNNLICIASSKWTLVNADTGKITKITPDIINCYKPEDSKNVFGEIDIPKLKEPNNIVNAVPSYTFNVQRRDIDINNHMHNLYYLDYAIEALPQQVYENLYCDEFEIMYKNAIKLGDTVNCFYYDENNSHFVVMKSSDDSKLYSIIKFKK